MNMESLFRELYMVLIMFHILCRRGLSLCDILVYSQDPPRLIEEEFRDMPAKFGDPLSLEGIRGFVSLAEPETDACQKLNPPPLIDNFTGKWIVLIARYNCSFEVKIRNAQAAGFDAAIVHNVNSSALEVMSAKHPASIKIPSVFVSEETGFIIENNYLYGYGYFVVINGELPFNINTHLLLPFAVVVGLSLIIMIVFMIVKCIKDRRRARRHRLPYNALKKIPTCKYAKGDPYDTCAICLDDYLEGDKLRVLPCAHAYHCKCIDPWLTKNRRVCPVCKRRVFAVGESRRRARATDPEDAHAGHSSSESDDDRTPLVYPQNNVTQGGTFQEQRENPFLRAASRMGDRLRRAVAPSTEQEDNATNVAGHNQEVVQGDGSPTSAVQCADCEDRCDEARPTPKASDSSRTTAKAVICARRDKSAKVRTSGGSCPEHVSERRANVSPADPFLTGVLNMRGDHFAMSRDNDRYRPESSQTAVVLQPAHGSTVDTEALLGHEHSRESKNKDKKQSSRSKKAKGKRHRPSSETDAQPQHSRNNESFVVNPAEHSINVGNGGDQSIGVAAIPNDQFMQPEGRRPASGLFNLWKNPNV